MFRLLTVAVFASALAVTTQRIDTRAVRVVRQTDSTATLVTSWATSNADSVRLAYSTGTLRTRLASRRVDTLVVARLATAQTVSVSLTPIRRTTAGAARSASVTVPARAVVEPPPTVDSVRVDTLRPVVTPPVVTPPTPQPTGSFTPNLPAGLPLITDARFNGMQKDVWSNADRLMFSWSGRVVTDQAAPFGGSVFETVYPGNDAGNGEGGAIMWGSAINVRRLYFALMMFVPSNYSVHTCEEKFFYPVVTVNGAHSSSTIFGWYLLNGQTANGPTFSLGMDAQIGQGRVYQPTTGAPMRKGVWQRVEFFVQMNTPGQANGIWQAWIDGVEAIDRRDVRYSNASGQAAFEAIRFDGTRGCGASSVLTPPGGQVRRYNRLAVYGAT